MLNDSAIIGTVFTLINTDIKHKDKKDGDKTKAESYLLSLYRIQGLPNNFYVQGILSYSHNKIKNREFRRAANENYSREIQVSVIWQ